MENNQLFRQPAIFVALPSNNEPRYADIEFTNQIPILGMSVADELTCRIPDSLLNGQTTVDIIQNCCPSIKNAWKIPYSDLTTILAGIRIASDGNESEITIHCQKCKNFNNFSVNLQSYISAVKNEWNTPLSIFTDQGNITINYRAPSFGQVNKWNLSEFKINKQLYQVQFIDLEYQEEIVVDLMDQKESLLLEKLIYCIKNISVDDYVEEDKSIIKSFIINADNVITAEIYDTFDKIINISKLPNFTVTCPDCDASVNVSLDLDFSNNFRNQIIVSSEEEILNLFQKMASQSKDLKADVLKMIWFMRGALTYNEAIMMTRNERELINKLIKENLETTKKTGLNFF